MRIIREYSLYITRIKSAMVAPYVILRRNLRGTKMRKHSNICETCAKKQFARQSSFSYNIL